MRNLITIALLVLAVGACASAGTKFDMSQVDAMTPGVTTFDDAVKVMGKPTSQQFTAEGKMVSVWVYAAAIMGSASSRSVSIGFDKDGKMIRVLGKSQVGG